MYNEKTYYIIFPELKEVVKGSFQLGMACLVKFDFDVAVVATDNLEVVGVNYPTKKRVTTKDVNNDLFYLDDGYHDWLVRK